MPLKHTREVSDEKIKELIEAEDACIFLLLGSCLLLGLFIQFKLLDEPVAH
ncbi:hypothetical protein PF005_g11224 [Phytophthora fragariae]|uniref:Uncharacterized protein n=1 Tax=Phytophthora fragariae TaxID=53985 RepID=A0A6A3L1S9_9STRA|nr:hypothetical protein PF003_g39360 [Phytophthora fragariae]KAE8937767.1 hypothetical protein PF009_g12336 [Phytophthora fragariae]KAE9009724.1 hypothetical protein PF011_g10135 [Phytophthora fragariae]KAE9112164.1 hypothetical protein PF010_g10549 [Phytophthora fragariae]KAE9113197.1 hypothetical protein PF007_g10806 [Phytophthora fragariae]